MPGYKAGTGPASHYAVSAFTRQMIAAVAADHYRLRAWRTLVSQSWERSLEDIKNSPARARSFWRWAIFGAATGAGILLLALQLLSPERAFIALALWLPWYAGAVFFLLTHLGMVDDSQGRPQQRLLPPNGISFLRLALAPLVVWPCLQLPVHPLAGPVFALFLASMSLSDLLDGWLARRQALCTRMGRMLDVLADLALLTFLTVGLYRAGGIPGMLVVLLVLRYPALLLGVLILYFARGPLPLRPTIIGRVTTFATSVVLLVIAATLLLPISWPTPLLLEISVTVLCVLLGINLLYLLHRAIAWLRGND